MTAYLRSVFLAPNKAVFDVHKLPAEEYALSIGLSAPPKLRFIKKGGQKSKQACPSTSCTLPHLEVRMCSLVHSYTFHKSLKKLLDEVNGLRSDQSVHK